MAETPKELRSLPDEEIIRKARQGSRVRGYRVLQALGSKIEGGERSSMSEKTSGARSIEELEDEILVALDQYFEVRRSEVEERKESAGGGTGFGEYEEARRKLAEVEQELEELRRRTEELKAEALGAVMGDEEAPELEVEVSELQEEVSELADAERSALERKREAEERLRQSEQAGEALKDRSYARLLSLS